MCWSVLGALQLLPKGGASGDCALLQHFLKCRKYVMPFSRATVTEYGLDRVDLSFTSIIKSSYCLVQYLPPSLHSHPVGLH